MTCDATLPGVCFTFRPHTRVRVCGRLARVGGQTRGQSARDLCEIMRFGCVIRTRPVNTATVAAYLPTFYGPHCYHGHA